MTWLRIDDNFTQHPKIVQLPARDRWTWMEVLCYCARYRTQGLLASNISGVIPKATHTFLERCVELGLLDRVGESFRVHDWEIYNGDTVAARVAAFVAANPDASANQVFRFVGGTRDVVLAEVARLRALVRDEPTIGTEGGTESGTESVPLVVLAPSPSLYRRSLPSAGTTRTSFVCPVATCRVSKKTERKLLEHLADVHGDESALARVHALEEQKP